MNYSENFTLIHTCFLYFLRIFCIKEEMRRSIDIKMNVGQMNQSNTFANFTKKECFLSIAWFKENKRAKNEQNISIERQTFV